MIGQKFVSMTKLPLFLFTLTIVIITASCNSQKENNTVQNEEHKYTNDLINESSPYLLQHAHNPVNWMPWGDAAFEKAKTENKLVLVSIGYSSCHWCHVMEHESFEDEEVANLMNEKFICIKVDREERPDVDQVYMNAVQLMTGSGGWPLNCFTLPDGRPIYGGTYFQKTPWMELLENLDYKFQKSPQEIENFANNLTNGIQQSELIETPVTGIQFSAGKLDTLMLNWIPNFDTEDGGNLRDIKFPLPNNLDFMMQYAYHYSDTAIMDHVDLTLRKMALGGIYDQVGGGFARYSTDVKWKVPHFEKMLYDNAQLVSLYAKAYQRTKDPLYKHVVYQTLEWAYREMMTPEGSFYSALDADSDGEEGKFYVWTKEELKATLNEDDYDFANSYYNIGMKTLWEGNHILLREMSNKEYALRMAMSGAEVDEKAAAINKQLLEKRSERIRPGLDDKSLTSWNALMTIGLLDAYQAFDEQLFLNGAILNAKWMQKKQLNDDGSLLHTYKNGESKINGFLEDYCFAIEAFTKLYEVTFDEKYIEKADLMATYAFDHFYDEKSGMFFFSSDEEGALIARKMEISDNVIPASNSAMANAIYDLGILLDKRDYKEKAKQMLANVYGDMDSYGSSYTNWGILALNIVNPYYELAITGEEWKARMKELNQYYIPNRLFMGGEKESDLEILEGKFMDETTIFVCIEGACKMPTNATVDAVAQMNE